MRVWFNNYSCSYFMMKQQSSWQDGWFVILGERLLKIIQLFGDSICKIYEINENQPNQIDATSELRADNERTDPGRLNIELLGRNHYAN